MLGCIQSHPGPHALDTPARVRPTFSSSDREKKGLQSKELTIITTEEAESILKKGNTNFTFG